MDIQDINRLTEEEKAALFRSMTEEERLSLLHAQQEARLASFREKNRSVQKGQTVFAGSSLMENFPIEELAREDGLAASVYNRGIGGYITRQLLDNIGPCILDLAPAKLFINIGTNDLSNPDMPIPRIMELYGAILEQTRVSLPGIALYLMAYYPINYDAAVPELKPVLAVRTNEKIGEANRQVEKLAQRFSARYLDVNAPLTDEAGNLRAEYTLEGMHINEQGYRAVYPLLKPYILE